jgi:tetratricopeptide (TPR) repeat protein
MQTQRTIPAPRPTRLASGLAAAVLAAAVLGGALPAAGASGQATPADHDTELAAARAMLHDAAVRLDGPGVQLARERLAGLVDGDVPEARVSYLMAFADFASVLSPNMSAPAVPPDEMRSRLARAIDELDESLDRDPQRARAWALRAVCEHFLASLTQEGQREVLFESRDRSLERGADADPDDPELALARAMVGLSSGDADAARDLAATIDVYRAIEIERGDHGRLWWSLMSRGMQARMDMMSGQNEEALALIDEILRIEPDFAMATVMRPRLEAALAAAGDGYRPLEAGAIPELRWTELSSDPEGDGRDAAGADARGFAYAMDPSGDEIWFRFRLHGEPSADAFGVNVIVDTDADQSTGTAWWGTNGSFTWERIVTVWLARSETGRYDGALGVGDLAGAREGDFTNLQRGGIRFAVLESERAIVIAVPRCLLADGERVNLIGAVGSNRMWNDDALDEGYATIELTAR